MVREARDGGVTRAIEARGIDELPPGDTLIRVQFSSLNYRDCQYAGGQQARTGIGQSLSVARMTAMMEREVTQVARAVQQACIAAARQAFTDAAQSGLCGEGALEAAIGAIQTLDIETVARNAARARQP